LEAFDLPPGALPVIVATACIVAGALLYRLIEVPFMNLRARWFPTNFPSPERLVGKVAAQ
jgi:peptidoglycan/LPS O-acetylase OafA/YrhL